MNIITVYVYKRSATIFIFLQTLEDKRMVQLRDRRAAGTATVLALAAKFFRTAAWLNQGM